MTAPPPRWQNRIVGTDELDPKTLLANPLNWRLHSQAQQDALAGVLSQVGWVQNVIVNRRSLQIVDGHLRVSLAARRDEPTIPVVYVDLDEAEERLILATLDPLAALAAMDAANLKALLATVSTDDAALQSLLTDLGQDAQDRIAAVGKAPSLDELDAGEIDPTDFWPVIRVKVPPDLMLRYTTLLAASDADSDHEKFADLLDRVGVPEIGGEATPS